ncbi:hypothetical protein QE152_g22876 [Popillia japonica]|uniref:Uncharacterized protein n=1 Tax=Popillia japonica TaxID=7064 RepID=A0AAW1KIN0_POPJA
MCSEHNKVESQSTPKSVINADALNSIPSMICDGLHTFSIGYGTECGYIEPQPVSLGPYQDPVYILLQQDAISCGIN